MQVSNNIPFSFNAYDTGSKRKRDENVENSDSSSGYWLRPRKPSKILTTEDSEESEQSDFDGDITQDYVPIYEGNSNVSEQEKQRLYQTRLEKVQTVYQKIFSENDFTQLVDGQTELNLRGERIFLILSEVAKNENEAEAIELVAVYIHSLVVKHHISFPFLKIASEDADKDFASLSLFVKDKKSRRTITIIKPWKSKYGFRENADEIFYHPKSPYNHFRSRFFQNSIAKGKLASNHFFQVERLKVSGGTSRAKAPLSRWNNQNHFLSEIRNTLRDINATQHTVTSQNLRKQFSMRGVTSCQFRPVTLAGVIDLLVPFGLPATGVHVFDPCAGWGDRATGALALDNQVACYVSTDANPELLPLMKKLDGSYNRGTHTLFLDKPVEEVTREDLHAGGIPKNKQFDLYFTSPPYYFIHTYQGEKQSTRYLVQNENGMDHDKSYQNWLDNFFYKMLDQADDLLKPGGFIVINIDDVRDSNATEKIKNKQDKDRLLREFRKSGCSRLTDNDIAVFCLNRDLNEYLFKKGYRYIGVAGYGMPLSPLLRKMAGPEQKHITFAEPMWFWQKPYENSSSEIPPVYHTLYHKDAPTNLSNTYHVVEDSESEQEIDEDRKLLEENSRVDSENIRKVLARTSNYAWLTVEDIKLLETIHLVLQKNRGFDWLEVATLLNKFSGAACRARFLRMMEAICEENEAYYVVEENSESEQGLDEDGKLLEESPGVESENIQKILARTSSYAWLTVKDIKLLEAINSILQKNRGIDWLEVATLLNKFSGAACRARFLRIMEAISKEDDGQSYHPLLDNEMLPGELTTTDDKPDVNDDTTCQPRPLANPQFWTKELDQRLLAEVPKWIVHGRCSDWSSVATALGKPADSCRKRFIRLNERERKQAILPTSADSVLPLPQEAPVKASSRRELWSKEQDARLKEEVAKWSSDGKCLNWKEVANALGKSKDASRVRYRRLQKTEERQAASIMPKQKGWTKELEKRLQEEVEKRIRENGIQGWEEIGKIFNKNPDACRLKYKKLKATGRLTNTVQRVSSATFPAIAFEAHP